MMRRLGLSVWRCYSSQENGPFLTKLYHNGPQMHLQIVLVVKVKVKGHEMWSHCQFHKNRYSSLEYEIMKFIHYIGRTQYEV